MNNAPFALIKQWCSRKSGISARFYMSNGCLFVDFNGCHSTAEVFIKYTGVHQNIAEAVIYDNSVPLTYRNWIKAYIKRTYSKKLRA